MKNSQIKISFKKEFYRYNRYFFAKIRENLYFYPLLWTKYLKILLKTVGLEVLLLSDKYIALWDQLPILYKIYTKSMKEPWKFFCESTQPIFLQIASKWDKYYYFMNNFEKSEHSEVILWEMKNTFQTCFNEPTHFLFFVKTHTISVIFFIL